MPNSNAALTKLLAEGENCYMDKSNPNSVSDGINFFENGHFKDGDILRAEDLNNLIAQINYLRNELERKKRTAKPKNILSAEYDASLDIDSEDFD